MYNKLGEKTFTIALSGISLAFTVICIFAASIAPGAELTCYALASLFVGFLTLERGIRGGILLYAASLLLALILVPNKAAIFPYAIYFGIYPVVKFAIEKFKSPLIQLCAKGLFSAAVFSAAYFIFKELFVMSFQLPQIAWWILIPGGIVLFIMYDYIFSLALSIYRKRIKREQVEFKLSGEEDGNEKR